MVGRPKGLPKTGGRQKGVTNHATRDIKARAQEFTDVALKALSEIALRGESESARVSAATALLDRAYGKPRQEIEHSGSIGRGVNEMSEDELIAIAAGRGERSTAPESRAPVTH